MLVDGCADHSLFLVRRENVDGGNSKGSHSPGAPALVQELCGEPGEERLCLQDLGRARPNSSGLQTKCSL